VSISVYTNKNGFIGCIVLSLLTLHIRKHKFDKKENILRRIEMLGAIIGDIVGSRFE
jgi:hypothetical protein